MSKNVSKAKHILENMTRPIYESSFAKLVKYVKDNKVLAFLTADSTKAMPEKERDRILLKYGHDPKEEGILDYALKNDSKFRREYDEILRGHNNKRYDSLKNELRYINHTCKIGYYKVRGGYIETLTDGTKVKVEEKSVVLFGEVEDRDKLLNFAKSLGEIYDQECIMFVENQYAKWHYTAGPKKGQIENVGNFNAKQVGDFYSKLLGHTISFAKISESKEPYPMNTPTERQVAETFAKYLQQAMDSGKLLSETYYKQ